MHEKIIDLQNVHKTFGGVRALRGVNFDLYQGEVHCLIGQNGCGKSTLVKIIAGVLKQDSGEKCHIDGVSVIYQDLSLFPNLTVGENIWFPLYQDKKYGVRRKNLRTKAQEALTRLKVDIPLDRPAEQLSVADRQLVAIARAIITESRILIMDEPTSSLTVREVKALFGVITRLQADGVSIIFVSHKLDEIIEIADRITVMRDGEVVKTLAASEANEEELSFLISGYRIQFERNKREHSYLPLMEVEQYTRGGEFEDISFTLGKGEVLGIAGQLGSGRTELALSLFGLTARDSGRLVLDGEEKQFRDCRQAIDAGIAYVPEDRILQGLAVNHDVEGNLTAVVLKKFRSRLGLLSHKDIQKCTMDWIERLSIRSAYPEMMVSALSGGNQQKVVLAKWLETMPKVLILDQPTNGIDIGTKASIYELVASLAESGLGIILISDELQELYINCNRVIVMQKGRQKTSIHPAEMTLHEFREKVKEQNEE